MQFFGHPKNILRTVIFLNSRNCDSSGHGHDTISFQISAKSMNRKYIFTYIIYLTIKLYVNLCFNIFKSYLYLLKLIIKGSNTTETRPTKIMIIMDYIGLRSDAVINSNS